MKKKITILLVTTLLTASIPVFAVNTNDIKDQVNDNNEKIDILEQEKSDLQKNKKIVNSELDAILDEIKNTSNSISNLNSSIQSKEENIRIKTEEIAEMILKIQEIEADIVVQKERISEQEEELRIQEELLATRVRAAYKTNSVNNIIFTLIESTSIVDFTERLLFIERMVSKDHEIMDLIDSIISALEIEREKLEASQKAASEIKITLEQDKVILEEEKTSLERQKATLERELDNQRSLEVAKKTLIDNLSAEERRVANEIGDIMEENAALEAEIQKLIREAQEKARREEEERKAAEEAQNGGSTSVPETPRPSSGYIRPVSGRMTSPYGYRIHPIYGDRRFHTGVDYAAGYGVPVASTRSGTVILAKYHASYGNYIIVDHGDGVSSLYAHLSGFAVGYGQRVSQGQTIGYIGSTGTSTGPHLHFEIRVNGVHRNPSDYVK